MIARYGQLTKYGTVFLAMTGLRVSELDQLLVEVLPRMAEAEEQRLSRADRQRAIGGGHPFELEAINQVLLSVIWLRQYPTYEVLGYLFGVSDTTAGRVIKRVVPLLEAAGKDAMRMPDPGKKQRRQLDELLRETPELAVVIDSFEQRVQRPQERDEADRYYSGKKKSHTLKSQVVVDAQTGEICEVSASVPGPTNDLTLAKDSAIVERLPEGVGALGDLGYLGLGKRHPAGLVATPRRKPRGKPRPPQDVAYNRAFARRRVVVEHTIGRLRRYQALTQIDRHHRQDHSARTAAVAGLVNHQIRSRNLALA